MSSSRFRVVKTDRKQSAEDQPFRGQIRWIYILSFVLPLIVMIVVAILKELYPFGEKCFLRTDLYNQYMPFMVELRRKLLGGESLGYAWRLGLGTDFMGIYAYYLACPFNLLCIFVPTTYLIEFITILIFIKISLCGLTMSHYLRRHFASDSMAIVCFSLFYALSGFVAAYNWDIMWMDVLYLFPLVVLGLEELMAGKGVLRYTLFLALTIYTNYYLAIMVCIFLVLYFVILSIQSTKEVLPRNFLKFAGCSVLSAMMSGFVVLPGGMAILQTGFSSSTFPTKVKVYFNTISVIARHMMNVAVELKNDHWPNIYCGVAFFFLLPLYILTKQIPRKKKIPMLILIAFFIASYQINVLNFIWHGMNYPDSLPARQSFIYIFVLLMMGYEAFLYIREQNRWLLIACYAIGALTILICMKVAQPTEDYENYAVRLTLLFLTSYCIFGVTYLSKTVGSRFLIVLMVIFTTFEVGINTYNTSVSTVTRSKYLATYSKNLQMKEFLDQIDSSPFYRVDKNNRMTKNDGALSGFETATMFSSTSNSGVVAFYTAMGMDHSKVYYNFDGATPLIAAMLGVKYYATDTRYDWSDTFLTDRMDVADQSIYRVKGALSLGYAVDSDLALNFPLEGDNAFELQNTIGDLLGVEDALFYRHVIATNESLASFVAQDAGTYYMNVEHGSKTRADTIKLTVTDASGTVIRKKTYKNCRKGYLISLGYLNEGDQVTLETTTGTYKDADLNLYRMNDSAMEEALSVLGREQMEITSIDSANVSGTIDVSEDRMLVFSIPYDEGWSLYIDGVKVEPEAFAGAFISAPVTAGSHDIRLSYTPVGTLPGFVLTVVGLAVFVLLVYKIYKGKRLQDS